MLRLKRLFSHKSNFMRPFVFTANSIKVVLPKALTVNYECTRDDGLLLIFTPKLGIMSAKHLRDHIGNLRRQIYLLQR